MIAIIDVTGKNLTSLANAINRLGYDYQLTHDPEVILSSSQVILPGVGSAPTAMEALREYGLIEIIQTLKQPLLGICLGMQLLFDYSEEGQTACLGILSGTVKKIIAVPGYPVPHVGWNALEWQDNSILRQDLSGADFVYFVHSYAYMDEQHTVANCNYGQNLAAIVQKNKIYGMQFHPEKSAATGLILLKNFLQLE